MGIVWVMGVWCGGVGWRGVGRKKKRERANKAQAWHPAVAVPSRPGGATS